MTEKLEKILSAYQGEPIAIYGLGILTEKLLPEIQGRCSVIGLLDGCRTDGMLYGKRILSIEAVLAQGVRMIIVAARPESVKVIVKRVWNICSTYQARLVDLNGDDVYVEKKAAYSFNCGGVSKEQISEKIDSHDFVSVDLFDTLIMRQTLFPTDVFEIVEARLKEQGIAIKGFCEKRMESEKELGRCTVPTLKEIYGRMIERYAIPDVKAEELADTEWAVDYDLIVPREELCSLLKKKSAQGKQIYIVSDTFYTEKMLSRLLEKCGITWYAGILSSCEYRTGKTQALFSILKRKMPGKTGLHIGDSFDADVESAERNGLTSCQLYSGLELFERAGYLGVWDLINSLRDKIQVGMFISRLFNTPFQFETPGARISVENASDIGHLFFAPVISDFVLWFDRQIRKKHLKNVWFSARDGFLIQKLYDQLEGAEPSIYFLTSRIAAIRAGMRDEADIQYVQGMRFSGSLREQMKERFGIIIEETDGQEPPEGLLAYKQEILSVAEQNRKNYLDYLDTLEVREGDIAFFDFIGKGTVQLYLGRLLEKHLKGFYFLQLDEQYMADKKLDIVPFCDLRGKGALFDNFFILEQILTAPAPSVLGFHEGGNVEYAEETRTQEDLACIDMLQGGIQNYFETYIKLCRGIDFSENQKLTGAFLEMIHNISIMNQHFLGLKVKDPFFKRSMELADLL